ncbi:helix-turn-helix transcriptional regulator [Janthinobacterium agaricidamnosum]|uniref:Bacterial regulatory helix-turn-helix s, AraC family protein n=1 Tax=Janthinobacterium agaricidamnosum NBRC 102515 = DSM 9628 TaxID=1349767 RepID=W0V528_9BURK|nr:AraC family transcriptional regulator [Janthinobacterium agaricidamnosum]CDG82966.1 bacterial regulatory helix-turn-helix s, AraC family protein [Janthinobacterium agaricidamnosum NBRC 102515 = DSM 9628]
MDNLSTLLQRHPYQAQVFHHAEFCGSNNFDEDQQYGYLHIVRAGRAVMHHQHHPALEMTGNHLVFYPSGMQHRLHVEAHESALLLCARIQLQHGKHNTLALALPELVHVQTQQVDGLPATLELLYSNAAHCCPGQQLVLDRLCDVVLAQLLCHLHASGNLQTGLLAGHADTGMSRVLDLMHKEADKPWTLQQLADLGGMSRSKFAQLFHQLIGTTPADYLSEQRMLLAQALLKDNNTVKAVAIKVGYGSQSAFTKAFSARHGMSPRAWLNSLRSSTDNSIVAAR